MIRATYIAERLMVLRSWMSARARRRRSPAAGWLLGAGSLTLAANLAVVSGERPDVGGLPLPTQAATGDAGSTKDSREDELARAGHELTLRICDGQCHTFERIVHLRRASFEWSQLLVDMESRGAKASEEEFGTIEQYLTRHFGFVVVNRASAREFSAVLGLTAADAQAIVAYRKQHGNFEDLEALLKVPGIDRAALQAQTEALRFN